mgnify:CR=1 FL=1
MKRREKKYTRKTNRGAVRKIGGINCESGGQVHLRTRSGYDDQVNDLTSAPIREPRDINDRGPWRATRLAVSNQIVSLLRPCHFPLSFSAQQLVSTKKKRAFRLHLWLCDDPTSPMIIRFYESLCEWCVLVQRARWLIYRVRNIFRYDFT